MIQCRDNSPNIIKQEREETSGKRFMHGNPCDETFPNTFYENFLLEKKYSIMLNSWTPSVPVGMETQGKIEQKELTFQLVAAETIVLRLAIYLNLQIFQCKHYLMLGQPKLPS